MTIIIKKPSDIKPSEITSKSVYLDRRKFMKHSITTGMLLAVDAMLPAWAKQWPDIPSSQFSSDEALTSYKDITTYNNFYEFGTGKEDPAKNATGFKPRPWNIEVSGECNKPGTFDLEDFIKPYALQEYIYRLRCVEGWSMVIPWVGFSLSEMLKSFEPTSKAKFVEFTTLYDKNPHPRPQPTRI
ncbi:MAG: molybdopterin-dependent oxidoreductase, partial [Gammaproteobacteria bacterium]